MKQIISRLFVEGIPLPYKTTTGKGGRYVPQEVRDWQEKVATTVKNAMQLAGEEPSLGRIRLELEFYFPTYKRTDVDNHSKTTLDGIKGHAFKDDDQVMELHAAKCYLPEMPVGTPSGVYITITELTPTHQTRQDYNAKRRKAKP